MKSEQVEDKQDEYRKDKEKDLFGLTKDESLLQVDFATTENEYLKNKS